MVGTAVGLAGAGFLGVFGTVGSEQDPNARIVAFSVDGTEVTLSQVQDQIDQVRAQNTVGSDPSDEFQVMANAISGLIGAQVAANMAAARGVTASDDRALAMASEQLDQAILSFRQQAIADGAITAAATEKEFQDYFKRSTATTTAEFKEQRLQIVRDGLEDPAQRGTILAQFSQQMLQQELYTKTAVTDEEVKRSYETLVLKAILFDKQDMSADQRKAEAEKAIKELDAGTDFETVAAKYMANPLEDPFEYNRSVVEGDENLRPLASLKPGEHSGIVLEFGSIPTVYTLVEVKSSLPKDYDTAKAVYNDAYRRQKANNEFTKALDQGQMNAKVVWNIHGYEMIYRIVMTRADPKFTEEKRKDVLTEIVNDENLSDNPAGVWPGTLARYVASEQLNFMLSDIERAEMLETRANIIRDVLRNTESVLLRLTLVDIYDKLGDQEAVVASLIDAVTYNTSLDADAERNNAEINKKLIELEDAKKISTDAAKQVREKLIEWNKQKVEDEQSSRAQQQYATDLDKFNIVPPTGTPPLPPPTGTQGG